MLLAAKVQTTCASAQLCFSLHCSHTQSLDINESLSLNIGIRPNHIDPHACFMVTLPSVQLSKIFECKIVIIFRPLSIKLRFGYSIYVLGYSKEPSEKIHLSTHIICFGLEIRNKNYNYILLSECQLYPLFYKYEILLNWSKTNFKEAIYTGSIFSRRRSAAQ